MRSYSVCILVLIAGLAQARPVTWYLSGARMVDGAVAVGSFVYDADTNVYSNIDITTSGGSVFAGAHYTATAPEAGISINDRAILVTVGNLSNYVGTPALAIYPASALTNAGGSLSLLGGSRSDSFETTCEIFFSLLCDGPGPVRRYFFTGVVTTTPSPETVPTLSTYGLIMLALLLAGCSMRILRGQGPARG